MVRQSWVQNGCKKVRCLRGRGMAQGPNWARRLPLNPIHTPWRKLSPLRTSVPTWLLGVVSAVLVSHAKQPALDQGYGPSPVPPRPVHFHTISSVFSETCRKLASYYTRPPGGDILLYNSTHVLVGEDQAQHLSLYTPTRKVGLLRSPSRKMSNSDAILYLFE